nr:ribosomal protein L34 [Meringosphaera mediterranea]
MVKRTLGGTRRKSIRTSGFRARIKTTSGKQILQSRRKKKRQKLSKS